MVDVVEPAAAALVDQIQQTEGARPTVAQDQTGDRTAQARVVGSKRRRCRAVVAHQGAQHTRVDDGLAGAVGTRRVHGVRRVAE